MRYLVNRKSSVLPRVLLCALLTAAFAVSAARAAPGPGYTGRVAVEALAGRTYNGGAVTLYGRLANPGGEAVVEAGFYVGDGEETQRVPCALTAEALSAAAVSFTADAALPLRDGCWYRAFALCAGGEAVSDAVPFDGRAPLPPPALRLTDGARYTAKELALQWDAVEGAALYGVKLLDATQGSYLLGSAGAGEDAYLWVEGGATSVEPDAYRSKLRAGRAYLLTVCAAYDKRSLFGRSVRFSVLGEAAAASAAPEAETGLYCRNGDGTVTLYGSVDGGGRPLEQYGFYVGASENGMRRVPAEEPAEYGPGAFSLDVPDGGGAIVYRAYAVGANGTERMGRRRKASLADPDPFEPVERTAAVSKSYVPLLSAIDPEWQFDYIKAKPYNWANTEIEILNGWEEEHILGGFPFPGRDLQINRGAEAQFAAAAALLNETMVKVVYDDGIVSSFTLADLVKTAACYNSRYIYPSTTDGDGGARMPEQWSWRLSLHSWGLSVDVNAAVPVNLQKGINFALIRAGAVKLTRVPGMDGDGAVVFRYAGAAPQGKLVPDDVLNCILYELAFKPAGFFWGAYFGNNRTDAMHYTLIEVPAKKDIPLAEAPEVADD